MLIHKLSETLVGRADGDCNGLPYSTETVSSAGCSIHFWAGDAQNMEQVRIALGKARRERDIVYCCWSDGHPTGYWAHQDIG